MALKKYLGLGLIGVASFLGVNKWRSSLMMDIRENRYSSFEDYNDKKMFEEKSSEGQNYFCRNDFVKPQKNDIPPRTFKQTSDEDVLKNMDEILNSIACNLCYNAKDKFYDFSLPEDEKGRYYDTMMDMCEICLKVDKNAFLSPSM